MWRALRELRKWDLAPLGAVLVVALLAGGFYLFIATGGGLTYQERVRAYFMSREGGGATSAQSRLIIVPDCRPTREVMQDQPVYSCVVVFGDQSYTACFAWDGDRLVAGSRKLAPLARGLCNDIFWDRKTRSIVSL